MGTQRSTKEPVPARLRVFLSPGSTQAIILRRGPSKQVLTIGWDRSGDQFSVGQWLKGVIYTCAVSPDGRYWLYGASDGRCSYTVLARLPFLKAVDFYQHGSGYTFDGGGLFLSNRKYWLDTGSQSFDLSRKMSHFEICSGKKVILELLNAYPHSEQFPYPEPLLFFQNGWVYLNEEPNKKLERRRGFCKDLPNGWQLQIRFCLQKSDSPKLVGKGYCYNQYTLYHKKTGVVLNMDWDWVDMDKKRLLWSENGKIFASEIAENGINKPVHLLDTNTLQFTERIAPY